MAKSANQKQKLLYVAQFFQEKTDEDHEASLNDIIQYLDQQGISAERKSIYDDINVLIEYGYDIVKCPKGGYFMGSRDFELAEVKLLVDLVQVSKFITENKSRNLIAKLEKLVSQNQAASLKRQVVVADRNKTANETIYYSVDVIQQAIAGNNQIRFQYYEWDVNKQVHLRKNGDFYEVSPWLLTWDDENYYLVAYDDQAEKMKHYRVDKMLKLECIDKIRRGRAAYDKIDVAAYTRKNFGMFAGEPRTVRLACDNSIVGVIVDRFGKDVPVRALDDEHVQARVDVEVSAQFYGWVTGLGGKVRILAPEDVAQDYRSYLQRILDQYSQNNGKEVK